MERRATARVAGRRLIGALGLVISMQAAVADGIDHRVALDQSGVWDKKVERGLLIGLSVTDLGVALWEGGESRLGNSAWRTVDAQLIAGASSEGLKRIFTRERPSATNGDSNNWFAGGSNHSFPSGEAAAAAALVTPHILEYGHDHPWTYALAVFPLYVGVARVKAQAHWQTDVLGGWALGAVSGWYAHERDQPIVLQLMPHGVFAGLKKAW